MSLLSARLGIQSERASKAPVHPWLWVARPPQYLQEERALRPQCMSSPLDLLGLYFLLTDHALTSAVPGSLAPQADTELCHHMELPYEQCLALVWCFTSWVQTLERETSPALEMGVLVSNRSPAAAWPWSPELVPSPLWPCFPHLQTRV